MAASLRREEPLARRQKRARPAHVIGCSLHDEDVMCFSGHEWVDHDSFCAVNGPILINLLQRGHKKRLW